MGACCSDINKTAGRNADKEMLEEKIIPGLSVPSLQDEQTAPVRQTTHTTWDLGKLDLFTFQKMTIQARRDRAHTMLSGREIADDIMVKVTIITKQLEEHTFTTCAPFVDKFEVPLYQDGVHIFSVIFPRCLGALSNANHCSCSFNDISHFSDVIRVGDQFVEFPYDEAPTESIVEEGVKSSVIKKSSIRRFKLLTSLLHHKRKDFFSPTAPSVISIIDAETPSFDLLSDALGVDAHFLDGVSEIPQKFT